MRSKYFPPADKASPEGLLAIGGELACDWLTDAYRHGIFPWPVFEDQRLLAWWSPEPRAIIPLDAYHLSRRLRRTCRSGKFQLTLNRRFDEVVDGCATSQQRAQDTWITPEVRRAFVDYHQAGYAHSIEVWQEQRLVGGLYGVAIGGLFAGESMFYQVRDASKVALTFLVAHLRRRGYRLFDIQQLTSHTASLGAIEIPRSSYLDQLAEVVDLPITFGAQLEGAEDV